MSPTPQYLAEWRASVGLSQTEVANALGVSLRAWQYWEAGERQNPGKLLVRALRDLERELAEERKCAGLAREQKRRK